jgi:hypothetical protein
MVKELTSTTTLETVTAAGLLASANDKFSTAEAMY